MPKVNPKDSKALTGKDRYKVVPMDSGKWGVWDHEEGRYVRKGTQLTRVEADALRAKKVR
jgi:hypothetical protein